MTVLDMKWTSLAGYKPQKDRSVWRLGSIDLRKRIIFPSNERMVSLWRQCVPQGDELSVLERWRDESNNCIIEIPKGIAKKWRQPFLDAVGEETKEISIA